MLRSLIPLLLFTSAAVAVENWPDFRGPAGDGQSPSAKVPVEWSETNNVRWKAALPGRGWSSPVIWEQQVWLTTANDDGSKRFAVCVNRETGAIEHETLLFSVEKPEHINALNSFASPSPVVDADRVYLNFGTVGTAAVDRKSGQLVWKRDDMPLDHMEGSGSSPVLVGPRLIVTCDGSDVQYTAALDVKTGETVWKTNRSADLASVATDTRKAFATPAIAGVDGAKQLISPGAQAVYGYDPETGKELWRFRYPGGFSNVCKPLVAGDVAFINTGYMKPQMIAVKLGGSGDVTETNLLWKYTQGCPNKPTPLLIEGMLYMISDKSGVATCLDAASGELVWTKRLGGDFSASPIYAGGHIYASDESGKTIVFKPGPKFKQVAVNELDEGCMASPAVSGNAVLLRTKSHLYRIEARAEGSPVAAQ